MLHLVPVPQVDETPQPYAEALARLASIRHALRLVDPFGGGPASDPSEDDSIANSWNDAGKAGARCFDERTARAAAGTAAGLEALVSEQAAGREPNEAASQLLADEIRRSLEDVSRQMLRRA